MNIKVIPMSESAIQVQIEGTDYSISDIVHRELLSVKHVKFAGVAPPHPLIKIITIQVHTDGMSPRNAVSEAAGASKEKVDEILKVTRQAFPEVSLLKPPSSHAGPQESKREEESATVPNQKS